MGPWQMTISILAYDRSAGAYGGAAATGSLCVGGWVLRGDPESGMSASQGSLPSTLWGQAVLDAMRAGQDAAKAVETVTAADAGRMHRQLAALDPSGGVAHFTGAESLPAAAGRSAPGVVVAGNMLAGEAVLDACLDGFLTAPGAFSARLLAALEAAEAAGGDVRGFLSAALLVVSRRHAPLTLRIDHATRPLRALRDLHARATTGDYASWAALAPSLDAPHAARPYSDRVIPRRTSS